jgi:hypothetical protein
VTRFRYRPERSHLGTIYRPVATIIVEHKKIVVELPLYIDSGADISMIPYRFGKALRLDQTSKDRIRRIRGIAGRSVPYLVKRLTFIFGRTKISARVAWSMTEEVPLLLGRMDVSKNSVSHLMREMASWTFASTNSQSRPRYLCI